MRIRKTLKLLKTVTKETPGWSSDNLPPRWCPINSKTRPMAGDWKWRAARASSDARGFVIFAQVAPRKGNWKAVLIEELAAGSSVIARYEFHASHPGIHVHSDCDRCGVEVGASSMDRLTRFPKASSNHRRQQSFDESSFWRSALSFFNVMETKGGPEDLFSGLF